ncbi:chemotaxis protein CheW [Methylobacterium nonmethylotrophicum]|uniref:Chemotaxis protein CheW n=1 Tax=Methylobacterium nonmethylotrophicum TaxID=1141884 RepID=A0A4Z0NI27_9HYPH|nr:chemotaxis protein CheW [Methylobacterium nonmethylotrophicum]TGD95135.1 chemotaxis protein CheW [Methylobacterium nonmethylotrophicum]
MPEAGAGPAPGPTGPGPASGRFLIVSPGADPSGPRLALPAGRVRALAPVPALTRVPGAPAALAGLATARGVALPVLDLARLLAPDARPAPPGRMVIAEADEPVGPLVGLLVGRVADLAADPGGAEILDLPGLVAAALPRRDSGGPAGRATPQPPEPPVAQPTVALLALTVAGRPYALPLEDVEEVAGFPGTVTPVPGSGPASLGAMPWRGRVLPLLSLSALLGLGGTPGSRVAVVRGVGLVPERVGPVLRLGPEAIDPVPRALRGGGAGPVAGFARLDGGRTLACILSAQALAGDAERAHAGLGPAAPAATEPVVVIELAGDAYGLPAGAVVSVRRAPDALARVPRAPDFVAGMLTGRGGALPVLDLRRRLGLPPGEADGRRRLVVVEVEGTRAGLLVDGAARLLRLEAGAIRPAPGLLDGQDVAITRIAGLAGGGLLPLIDPAALVGRAEGAVVAALARSGRRAGPPRERPA